MGIKESVSCDEHWVLYGSDELNATPKANIALYVN